MPGWRWSGGAQAHWCFAKAWKQRLYFKIRESETFESRYASYKFISAPPFLPSNLAFYECMIFLWFFFKLPFRVIFSSLIPIALICMCLPWSWGLTFPHSLPRWVKPPSLQEQDDLMVIVCQTLKAPSLWLFACLPWCFAVLGMAFTAP